MQSALRIGVSYSTFLIEGRGRLVGGYTAIRPNVSLDFSAFEWSQDVVQKLHEGAVDFGIVIGPITDPDIDVCVLQRIDASLAIPREDPLATAPCVTLADLAGRRVAIGLKDTTGQRYAMTYGWIEDVGASAVPVLECRRFIFDVAERDRLFVICYADGEGMPPSFVRRSIKGPRPIFDLSLIRYKRTMSPAGERLWRLGQELAAGEAVAA
jgi:DNA-binding transcriptional LysR family regulator